jgi:diguanylate cyclase (GGDEF)-like protein
LRGALVTLAGAGMTVPLWALSPSAATAAAGAMHLGAMVTALFAMAASARTGDQAAARFRWALAAALAAVAVGAVIGLVLTLVTGAIPVPSVADPVTLAWVPIAVYGFWNVPRRDGTGAGGLHRLLADGAIAVTALMFASYLWILEPLAHSGRWTLSGRLVELSYPVLDIFIAAMVLSLLPRVRADVRPFLNVVAVGLLLVAVSDSGSVLLLAQRGVAQFGWPDVSLQAGLMLLALAARLRVRPVLREQPASTWLDRNLPYLPIAVAAALGLLHVQLVAPLNITESAFGLLMLMAIVWRQSLYAATLAATAELHRSASAVDGLTGLANRKAFISRLTEHLTTPGAGPAAVVLFDLDGFKEVNDTCGHDEGDEVLISFAARLAAAARDGLVARLGGDEFAMLLSAETDPEDAAFAIVQRVNDDGVDPAGPGRRCVRASAGITALQVDDTPSAAMRRADLAMYAAKHSVGQGERGRVCVFTPGLAAKADRRSLLLAAISGAAERDELHVVYQPMFSLADGTLSGAEALLRWEHPLLGSVGPDEFIPLAEDSGHISVLGRWVREQALGQMASWDAAGRRLPRMFINVAAAELRPQLPAEIAALLARHGLTADRLALEITESRLPGAAAIEVMATLRSAGVHLALDDFGTGYSSLAQLAHLPVDILKIDRDFMANLGENSGRPVLDAIVRLGRALGLTTVAEGVEDLTQAAEAANAGLDLAQGYLFSRPLRPDAMAAMLPADQNAPVPIPAPRYGRVQLPAHR